MVHSRQKKIPYARQSVSETDIQQVVQILKSDWLTQGPTIERFEQAVSSYCGAKHAAAVSSATAALHLACLAIGLGPGDWLWTSPNSFVASANCGLYCGSNVDFVDIDPTTYNMSVTALHSKLERAKSEGRLPKVVIPVHFSGQSCAMKEIRALSDLYGFHVIEDASHAIGGSYLERKVGCCEYSDMTVFSFHAVKIITTGEGGMVLTNDKQLANKLFVLRTHGITRDHEQMVEPAVGPWDYQQIELGLNYRLTDLQAALGTSQLDRIDEFVTRRHSIAERYYQSLSDLPLVLPYQSKESVSAFHLFVVQLVETAAVTRLELVTKMQDAGIGVNVHYIPVHLQPFYKKLGFKCGDFPEAESYYNHAITLPLFVGLEEEEQQYVIDTLRNIVFNA